MINNNIIKSILLTLFALLCDMNNVKKKSKEEQTKGAIMMHALIEK